MEEAMSEEKNAPETGGDPGATGFRAMPGSLYVVATPLGNARDLTLRAIDILRSVDVVAAEDTRVTGALLARMGIAPRLLSLHAHNEARRADAVIAALTGGRSVALATDAGTPAISDPGARVVRAVRDAGFPVVPVPGPSALAAAVSAAGLTAERFAFIGFLPSQPKARRALLAPLAAMPLALVLYEAPHRVRDTIAFLADVLPGERMLVVARELTKMFETIAALPLDGALQWIDADSNRQRGEFVLIVDAAGAMPAPDVERWLAALLQELPPARAARVAAAASGVPRAALYARALALRPADA
jgi:16S rRNA (cytidine1402-2'-O)-methyltransferase